MRDYHLNTGLFDNRTTFDHFRYSDGYCRSFQCITLKTSYLFVTELMSDYMSTPRQNLTENDEKEILVQEHEYNASLVTRGFDSIKMFNSTFLFSTEFVSFVGELWPLLKETLGSIENKELKVITVLLAVGVFTLIRIFQQNVRFTDILQR